MSKKHNHIDYLSPELFKAYRQGDLSQEEAHAVERYLTEKPFEAAALEGLEAMPNDALESHLDDLSTRVDKRVGEEKETKTIFWTLRRVAAGLVLLASASALYFWTDQPITTKELTQEVKKDKDDKKESESGNLRGEANSVVSADKEQEPANESDDNTKAVEPDKVLQGWADSSETTQANKKSAPAVVEAEDLMVTEMVAEAATPVKPALIEDLEDSKFEASKRIADESAILRREEIAMMEAKSEALTNQVKTDQRVLLGRDSLRSRRSNLASGFVALDAVPSETQLNSNAYIITGQVTGKDDGLPLPQVTVLIPGTTNGTPTDANGKYMIIADTVITALLFRYLGYTTQEVAVQNRKVVDVSMEPNDQELGEMLVTASRKTKSRKAAAQYIAPIPIGSDKGFKEYVKDNLRYPEAARAQRVRGRVTLEFNLSAEGTITNIRVIKGLGSGCDEEAIRLLKEGPSWEPKRNKQTGEAVDSKVQVKIRFKP